MNRFRLLSRSLKTKLKTEPLKTNIVVGGVLACAGDVLCQTVVENRGGKREVDFKRLFAFTVFGAVYTGGISYKIYAYYEHTLLKYVNFTATQTAMKQGLFLSLVDNFLHVPFLYTPLFFASTSLMQGLTIEETTTKTFNFGVIPGPYQVVFMNSACLIWNVILDYVAERPSEAKEEAN